MEETSSERLVRSINSEILTVDDDVAIIFISQDDPGARYRRVLLELHEQLRQMRLELPAVSFFGHPVEPLIFPQFLPFRYPDFLDLRIQEEEEDLLLGGASQRPQLASRKTRRRRDPPPRVSRRSSQVSPPIYLRHRFLPPSRKQSSSRRQRYIL